MRKLVLPLANCHLLMKWIKKVVKHVGYPVYLVGSQLSGKKSPRDIDLIMVVPDMDFLLLFGIEAELWIREMETGEWSSASWGLAGYTVRLCRWAWRKTEMNIDFRIVPETDFQRGKAGGVGQLLLLAP